MNAGPADCPGKIFLIVAAIAFAASTNTGAPRSVLDSYFNLLKKEEYEKARALLCENDQKLANKVQYAKLMKQYYGKNPMVDDEIKSFSDILYDYFESRIITYSILDEKKEKGRHVFTIEIRTPDIWKSMEKIGDAGEGKISKESTKQQRDKMIGPVIKKVYPDGGLDYDAHKFDFAVFKENGSMKIQSNLQQIINWEKAYALRNEAFEYKKNGELTKAIQVWSLISKLDPDNSEAASEIKEIKKKINESRELLSMKPDPEVRASMKIVDTKIDQRFGSALLSIANTGDKTIDALKGHVLYLSTNGEIVLRKTTFDDNYNGEMNLAPGDTIKSVQIPYLAPLEWGNNPGMHKIVIMECTFD
ncbi:MAG: hypothetical protein GF350_06305 [Chitinivibrionales bacterium]|nr:hypothetical protein [Chitinivibrionales bacterium]